MLEKFKLPYFTTHLEWQKSLTSVTIALGVLLYFLPVALANTQTDCMKSAGLAFRSTQDQAAEVCEEADSNGPALCFRKAVDFHEISPRIAAQLCRYSNDNAPADCYRNATVINNLRENSALRLCKASKRLF